MCVGIDGDERREKINHWASSGKVGKGAKWTEDLTAKCCRWPRFRWRLPARRGCCQWLESYALHTYIDALYGKTRLETCDPDGDQRVLDWMRPGRETKKSHKYVARMFFNPSRINGWVHQFTVILTELLSSTLDSAMTVLVGNIYSVTGFYVLLVPVR